MSVKRAISHSVIVKNGHIIVKNGHIIVKNGHIIVKNGHIIVKNGLILVQKPGKGGFPDLALQPPEPYLIYGETYRGGQEK